MFNNMMKCPYKILGVSSNVNDEQLKIAYRNLALKYHPDINNDPLANEYFKEVNSAYDLLKTPDKRANYDNYRDQNNFNNDKIFENLIFESITIKISRNILLIYIANLYQLSLEENVKIDFFFFCKGRSGLNDVKTCNSEGTESPEGRITGKRNLYLNKPIAEQKNYIIKFVNMDEIETILSLAPFYIKLITIIIEYHKFYTFKLVNW